MGKTPIEWTDFSINPIRARHRITGAVGHYCEKITAGCKNWYASRLQSRFRMPAFNEQRGDDNIEVFLDESKLEEVLRRKKPTKYFWCDMTDMFGAWVPDEMIDKCFAVMALTPWHTHQVLTKRPERMRDYLIHKSPGSYHLFDVIRAMFPDKYPSPNGMIRFPLPNVWLGVSCEDQKTADQRIPLLRETPAAVRFLSCEPLLGAIDLTPYLPCVHCKGSKSVYFPVEQEWGVCRAYHNHKWEGKIQWVIVGGESGHGARPMHPAWARSLRDQCEAAGVAFHFKQWGEYRPTTQEEDRRYAGKLVQGRDACGYYCDEKVGHVDHQSEPMLKVGKKAAGRLLDGKEHNGFPEVKR